MSETSSGDYHIGRPLPRSQSLIILQNFELFLKKTILVLVSDLK